ncbi:hypothetical protein TVAG_353290 [Trichomonas vaginalis G3]|uniref:Uncharacterized protein n=1 Tax=Trichomonas vaginalis (strain ATCC PRA-98 / G3) TaxID=412133 RepID=A2EN52_TRIV3|nr:hypothetical protein TVAGG3_0546590 [Trichomonas vaginalis G3]EAY05889.1 hypothetical protein TVAG_353290 [Trichomonas vaginalis G3]KAI5520227.1 hypothetical protein TVAGG3_0546590 [Trichomonas vaginalis G3]|eukprot:XP_001318112.1 hypothetical protein [Trichomonas vaginalis G3]
MSSLLIVAALYELMNKGAKFFSDSTLPVCSGNNVASFEKINVSPSSSSMVITKSKVPTYINRRKQNLPNSLPPLLKDQIDTILNQFNELSKIDLSEKSASIYYSFYSPESNRFGFYCHTFTPVTTKTGIPGVRIEEIRVISEFEGFHRFASSTFVSQDKFTDSSSSDDLDTDGIIGSIQFSLIPISLTTDNLKFLEPIAKAAIEQIDAKNYPTGVTEANAEVVKQKLNQMITDGFKINLSNLKDAANQKCKK